METVSTKPERGSAEYFADVIRRQARDLSEVNACLIGIIDAITDFGGIDDTVRVARVRSALAAAKLVRAEMRLRDGS